MQLIKQGICAPKGFFASGVSANIKGKGSDKKDLAVVFSNTIANAAGVFTTNVARAAPVKVSERKIKLGKLQAIVINAGNANACTGPQGATDATQMCDVAAKALNVSPEHVAVSSTGIIGVPLPMNRILPGVEQAAASISLSGNTDAATAIMTTDTFMKEIALCFEISGRLVTIGAMAKGSGMIHPNMATTLGFVTTDADISSSVLQLALSQATDKSFNAISVDGDTSTNDMILAMANGQANNPTIELNTTVFTQFCAALDHALIHLAKEVARDGEGATKLLEMQVHGAPTLDDAKKAARAVCTSPLVKTALFGNDGNWGRIVCALGYSGAQFDVDQVDLYIGDIQVVDRGAGVVFDESNMAKMLGQKEVVIKAYLHHGQASATAWGCDLSHEYIKINGSYRS